jgi:excisionase family DNA binding protein
MLRVKQAAEFTGLSERIIRKMCRDGILLNLKVGRIYLINKSVLLETIGEQSTFDNCEQ